MLVIHILRVVLHCNCKVVSLFINLILYLSVHPTIQLYPLIIYPIIDVFNNDLPLPTIYFYQYPIVFIQSYSSSFIFIFQHYHIIHASTGALALQCIGKLSGGQKSRVILAMLTINRPHILLLDEPTNNLDMDSINILKLALKEYQGAFMIASHDMNFIRDICADIYQVIPYKQLMSMNNKSNSHQHQFGTMKHTQTQNKKSHNNSSSGRCGSSSGSYGNVMSSIKKLENGVDEYREIVMKAVESQKKLCA